ncbi:DNA-binding response OmpR family regulator [Phycicoccus badiiscoriae]|uniref:DNA-binding response OmpR family regulator n=1 Tax=Pedococcus badiiscoriae TaxID=642776 RepID=A0A852WTW8_9MICO|nr:DNA-binding response OmpR family regulator [Pedococcus badiiscoriae]
MTDLQPLVLVADDDPDVVELVDYKLTRAGYRTITVSHGLGAWEAFISEQPDLLILDIQMPGLSGTQILRRARMERPDVPVILLSALSRDDDIATGFAMGADDYIVKPFSPRELISRVKRLMRQTHRSWEGADGSSARA